MKRYTSLFLILCLLFSLTACKRKGTDIDIEIDSSGNAATADTDITTHERIACGTEYIEPSDKIDSAVTDEQVTSDAMGVGIEENDKVHQPTEDEKYAYFKKIHPGCTVTVDHNGEYTVTNINVSIDEYKTPELLKRQTDDGWDREGVEEWLQADCMEYTIIFKGKRTGNTIQKVLYSAYQLPATPSSASTLVEMEVTEPYYGNIEVGDKVWVSDGYGVVYENGEYKLNISNYSITNGLFAEEYVLHASKTFIPGVAGIKNEYSLDFFALPLDREYTPQNTWPGPGFDYVVYEKYILNKDIALNREEEMEKQLRKNESIVAAAEDLSKGCEIYPDIIEIAQDIKNADYELTKRQLKMIDDALKRYGERSERVKNAG